MEIKKRLNAAARRLTPAIEAMNVGVEMKQHTTRIEELITYAEQKISASESRPQTLGQRALHEQDAEREAIAKVQDEEARENAADQNQQGAQPGEDLRTEEERVADEEAENARRESAQAE